MTDRPDPLGLVEAARKIREARDKAEADAAKPAPRTDAAPKREGRVDRRG